MSSFTKFPFIKVEGAYQVWEGWKDICDKIVQSASSIQQDKQIVVIEYYHGVLEEETTSSIISWIHPVEVIRAKKCMRDEQQIEEMVFPYVTDDRLFGRMSDLVIDDYFDPAKIDQARKRIADADAGIVLVIGTGASRIAERRDLLVYADMARWEIQKRMRKHLVDNVGVSNRSFADWDRLYRQGYFLDWRVCDRLKRDLMGKWDYLLDTNDRRNPKMVEARAISAGLAEAVTRPFSVVPFFDPGPWGGQWMKHRFDLDPSAPNYAWCFNCVPEEDSLLLKFGEAVLELPSIDLVFAHPYELLGDDIVNRFGAEFPIRFDYLDTFEGGNLSLQVHPTTGYIRDNFGVNYTQDESYYIMDGKQGAVVYLGLRENVDPSRMIAELEAAEKNGRHFDADHYLQTWPVRKHDHFLIPAGTVHCSGKDSLVLEISATPYIFTFKLWDWGRLGMDGEPRPINIEHGKKVIDWKRTTTWTKAQLVNRTEIIAEGDGWKEERTGLHETEFIETRRHWFSKSVRHDTEGTVNVLNLVEGDEAIVESPGGTFAPFVVHYAETFIVPAAIGEYTIRPCGTSLGKECATIKAFVRKMSSSSYV